MTTTVDNTYERYVVSGTGPYAFSFRIFNDTDLTVVAISGSTVAPLTLDSHYTVSDVNDPDGGSITLVSGVQTTYAGYTLDIRSNTPLDQPTNILNNSRFLPVTHQDAFDYLSRQNQDAARRLTLAQHLPDNEIAPDWSTIFSIANRKGKYGTFFNATTGAPELVTGLASVAITQSVIGAALYPQTAAEISAGVTPVNYAYAPGHLYRYGTNSVPGTTDMTTAIQNCLLTNNSMFVPNGTHRITASIELDDYQLIRCESRLAIIKGNLTAPLIRGRNGASDRTFGFQMFSGTLDNTNRSNAGGIGLDFLSMTMAKVFGTAINNVETAIRNGGSSSLGAFYNEFHGVDIGSVVTGVNNGTLGNENKWFGGRVNDCTTGTIDNNNSCNSYFGIAIEAFSSIGHQCSNTAASLNTRYYGSRIENPPSLGTAFSIASAAQDTLVDSPYIVGVTSSGLPAAGSTPNGTRTTIRYSELFADSGLTARKGVRRVSVTADFADLAAGAFRQEGPFTVTGCAVGDGIFCTLPAAFASNMMVGSCIITAANTVYVLIHNPSGAGVNQASLEYIFTIFDFT